MFFLVYIYTRVSFFQTHTTKFLQFFSYDSNAKKQSRSPNLMICKNSYSNSLSKNYCEKKYLKKTQYLGEKFEKYTNMRRVSIFDFC